MGFLCATVNYRKRDLAALFILFLGGCSSAPENTIMDSVLLAPGVTLRLTAPPRELWNVSTTQLLDIQFEKVTKQLVVKTEFSAQGINLVALTPAGMPVMEIQYIEANPVVVKEYIGVKSVDPSYIIADLQLALWPISKLNTSVIGKQSKVVQENDVVRKVIVQDKTVIEIQYQNKMIILQHKLRGYRLSITKLEN